LNLCGEPIYLKSYRIQEEVDHKDSGRVPRSIEAELTCDLVDSCVPGDVITISGIVKAATIEPDKGSSFLYIFI
jgi:DNA helicase MCM8